MKKSILILFICSLFVACAKEELVQPAPAARNHNIRIEVSGEDTDIQKYVSVTGKVNQAFTGDYSYEYQTASNQEKVNVVVSSEEVFTNTITIYADGQLVARRGGDCKWTVYSLEYTIVMK